LVKQSGVSLADATLGRPVRSRRADYHCDSIVSQQDMTEREREIAAIDILAVDPESHDAKWCFAQYFRELDSRFDQGFDPALSISADAHELSMPNGVVVVAVMNSGPVGCGALKLHPGWAELKRMWIKPDARGMRLGSRILEKLEQLARAANAGVIRLETNKNLAEAISLYKKSGYSEVEAFNSEPYAHHWFEKKLT
jgi:ribosomal protein S18 acetylase RimI-like enzyme